MTKKQDSILVCTYILSDASECYIQKGSCLCFAHRLVILNSQDIITTISKINFLPS